MAKIAFIQKNLYEHLGPMVLSAYLKDKNHHVEIFVNEGEKDLLKAVTKYNPDIIAFSCATGEQFWALKVVKKLKKEINAISIFGGPHPTFDTDLIKEESIDIICVGEGEEALLELAEALDKKQNFTEIKNLIVKKEGKIYKNTMRPLLQDLDTLPFPDRKLYMKYPTLNKITTKRFMAGRGCPYNCSFCYNANYRSMYKGQGKYVRKMSPERMIEEIKSALKIQDIKTTRFSDNTFTADKEWTKKFLDLYKKEINLPFSCLLRANEVDDELVGKLKEAGCEYVTFGIESGNDRIRNEILKKNLRKEDIIKAAKALKKHKIVFGAYNILGCPTETLDEAFETLYLNVKIKTDLPTCSVLQLYPGTPVLEYAREHNLIREGLNINQNRDALENWRYGEMEVTSKYSNEMANLQKFFFLACKMPFLIPLIKKLIKLPPNRLYDFIYKMAFVYRIRYVFKPSLTLIASYISRRALTGIKSKVNRSAWTE